MAVKPSYRVPYTLDQSYVDMTIALQSKDGSVGKVVPMLAVASYGLSALVCMFLTMRSWIGSVGSVFQVILFVILWAALTVVLSKYDGTRRMNMQRIATLLHYLPSSARHVYTRNTQNAIPFWNIVGIESIENDGLITYADKTFGYFYRVPSF